MNNGWKPHLQVNSWSCCRLLAFTLRSSLAVLPPFGLFSWSQPFTPADFLLFPLTARVSFMPSFLLVLLLDGQLAAQTGSSGCCPGRFLACGARRWKAKLMPYFVTYTGGWGRRGTAPPPPDVTVRLNADKPEVGKPNVSTREELAVSFFLFVLFCLLQHLKKKSIVYHVSVHLGLPTAVCQAGGVFLFLLSLSSPRALCCFTQTDLASGIRGPVFVTHCNSVCGERHRHHFKTRPDSAAAPHFRQGFFSWLCVFFYIRTD